MDIEIRNMQEDDISIAARVFFEAFNAVGEKWSFDTAYKRLLQYYDINSCWVALIDSKIVGMLTSKIDNVLDHQELYIDIIAVSPHIHKNGIGDSLLKTAEKYANQLGLKHVWLTASPHLFSYNWYLKRGFEETAWVAIVKNLDFH